MTHIFTLILNWSEVWALLVPLSILLFKRKQPVFMKPVIFYLLTALMLNITGDLIEQYNKMHPGWRFYNNPIYNIHSLLRFGCFSYFFILLKQRLFTSFKKMLPIIFILFVLINFTLNENFFFKDHLSGNLLSMEAFLLLIYCMLYYLSQLKGEVVGITGTKHFLVVTGLAIYVAANFFVFFFYVPMITENPALANNMWNVHNVAYILLCIFISKALYAFVAN